MTCSLAIDDTISCSKSAYRELQYRVLCFILYMCCRNAVDVRIIIPQPYIPAQATASPAQVCVSVPLELLFFSDLASVITNPIPTFSSASNVRRSILRPKIVRQYFYIDLSVLSQLQCYCRILWLTQNSPSRILHLFATSQKLDKLSEPQGNRHNVGHDTDSCRHRLAPGPTPQPVAVLHEL